MILKDRRVLLFVGDGKGKTTAALGTALRAVGQGQNVLIVQFAKDNKDGEFCYINSRISDNMTLHQCGVGWVMGFDMELQREAALGGIQYVKDKFQQPDDSYYDLVVLDELCYVNSADIVSDDEVIDLLNSIPCNVIMTGRNANSVLLQYADTVTEMKHVKHAFDHGVLAQPGIEY